MIGCFRVCILICILIKLYCKVYISHLKLFFKKVKSDKIETFKLFILL